MAEIWYTVTVQLDEDGLFLAEPGCKYTSFETARQRAMVLAARASPYRVVIDNSYGDRLIINESQPNGQEMVSGPWQPIETAPRTESGDMIARNILLFCPDENHGWDTSDDRFTVGWWEPLKHGGSWHNGETVLTLTRRLRPTHWMELPAPPEEFK